MSLVAANVGEVVMLQWALREALSANENLTLKLYSNDVTPTQSSVAGDFTEATFTDYAAKTLTRNGWNAPTTVANKASITYGTAQTWTAGSSQTIYGAYLVGATSGTLLFAERFDDPVDLTSGDSLTYTPVVTLNSEN